MLSLRHFPFPKALYYPCFIQARQLVWPQGYGSTLSAESSFVNGTELTISNAAIQHFSCLKVMLRFLVFFPKKAECHIMHNYRSASHLYINLGSLLQSPSDVINAILLAP